MACYLLWLTLMIRTAIILAAGRGSRLDPGGNVTDFSKPLMEVGGATLLHRTVDACRQAGARRVIVVTGFRAELVRMEVRRLDQGDLEEVYNPHWQKSNGVSLLACESLVSEDFALMMSDHIFETSILADLMNRRMRPGSVMLAVDRAISSVFDIDDATKVVIRDGRITQIAKQLATYNAIDCGLFACSPAIFTVLRAVFDETGDCSLSDGMRRIGERGAFLPFDIGDRWWQDVDTPDMLAHALSLLAGRVKKDPLVSARGLSSVQDHSAVTVG